MCGCVDCNVLYLTLCLSLSLCHTLSSLYPIIVILLDGRKVEHFDLSSAFCLRFEQFVDLAKRAWVNDGHLKYQVGIRDSCQCQRTSTPLRSTHHLPLVCPIFVFDFVHQSDNLFFEPLSIFVCHREPDSHPRPLDWDCVARL